MAVVMWFLNIPQITPLKERTTRIETQNFTDNISNSQVDAYVPKVSRWVRQTVFGLSVSM